MIRLVIIPLMLVDEHSRLGQAFEASRFNIALAQSRLELAAEDIAEFGLEAEDGVLPSSQPTPSYLVEDMVELSRARVEARVGSASFKAADEVSRVLISIGRQVDMRA